MKTDVGELIKQETERRLTEMESPSYVFPSKASKADWIAIVVVGLICVALIVKSMLELM